ncbi:DUF3014 domain-containing protein [Pseudidiomarina taiwanensis]|uniref:DUF3014 domain-containing protein n=1 Tax=Pseudidiomarina taiwanensis TaxID=337250 RepID=A0A432ZE62_9GAMM|nr:DUF3014 domain-containing protein [Pseudidiomarina taiwanensis]RUO75652.1 DUF3014 domain-containing protein [Pseudidiomarina taiwanensis]
MPTDSAQQQPEQSPHYGKIIVSLIVVIVIAIAIIAWLWTQNQSNSESAPSAPVPVATEVQEPEVKIEPAPEPTPIETVELEPEPEPTPSEPVVESIEQPLPAMAESNAEILAELEQAEQSIAPLNSEQLIRDGVVFVDNLRRGLVIRDKALVEGPKNRFRVLEQDSKLYIDPRSYDRYNTLVDWFVSLDNQIVVQLFERYQPLLSEALAEIGYPDADPKEVLNEAFEMVLATPNVGTVIELSDETVMYKFADEQLEALPDAQKQMLRMGPDNIRRVKLKIEALQLELNKAL